MHYVLYIIIPHYVSYTRNSSGDEIANVNFLRRHRTRTTAHNKVHFAYGKHTCPQLPNETLTIIDSRIGLNSATWGSSQDMSQCYCR